MKHYKLRSHIRGHAAGETVTEEQLKESGHDAADLLKRNAVEESAAPATRTDTPGIPSDEQNKLNVERAITDETVTQGRALSQKEQDETAARVTKESGRPVRTDGKDVNKAEATQEKAREAEQKAAAQQAKDARK